MVESLKRRKTSMRPSDVDEILDRFYLNASKGYKGKDKTSRQTLKINLSESNSKLERMVAHMSPTTARINDPAEIASPSQHQKRLVAIKITNTNSISLIKSPDATPSPD
jgi:hypothetical protein